VVVVNTGDTKTFAKTCFRQSCQGRAVLQVTLPPLNKFEGNMQEPKPRRTRTPERFSTEHLNSPVTDPGYYPYARLSGGLQETVVGVPEPRDPMEFVPPFHGHHKDDDNEF